jgi:hypothetical protein
VLKKVKVVFHEFEDKSKGGLNFDGLHSAMRKLHDNISRSNPTHIDIFFIEFSSNLYAFVF